MAKYHRSPTGSCSLEEPLLQKEILDRLLPRLEARFPARATALINAYNDLLKGVDTNTVFGHAFKTLEELAREISGTPKLGLNDPDAIRKSFPNCMERFRRPSPNWPHIAVMKEPTVAKDRMSMKSGIYYLASAMWLSCS